MTDWIRPGPPSIRPGLCPDGLVLHIYSVPGGLLLRTTLLTVADAETRAVADRNAINATVCLVFYDGDTGERMPPPPPSPDDA